MDSLKEHLNPVFSGMCGKEEGWRSDNYTEQSVRVAVKICPIHVIEDTSNG